VTFLGVATVLLLIRRAGHPTVAFCGIRGTRSYPDTECNRDKRAFPLRSSSVE